MNFVAIDIGGAYIKYALLDQEGNIIKQDKKKTIKDSKENLYHMIKELVKGFDIKIDGIAISCPGIINSKQGYIELVSLLPYLNKTYIKKELEALLQVPVSIENDANCAAYGELWKGSLQGVSTGAMIVLGSGVGGAFVINGMLHTGKNNRAGEIGGLLCDLNYQEHKATSFGRKYSSVWLIRDIAKATGLDEEDGNQIFGLIKRRDKVAYAIFEEYCFGIAKLIYNIDYLLDLEVVTIGGGISEQDILITTIKECYHKLRDIFEPNDYVRLRITANQFKNDANLVGALYYFFKQ